MTIIVDAVAAPPSLTEELTIPVIRRSLPSALGLLAAAVAITTGLTVSTAAASTVGDDDGSWKCTVPPGAGFVYDMSRRGPYCSNGYQYHVVKAADGIKACTWARGFTYDQVIPDPMVCSASPDATSLHLRLAADGLWACMVPSGFTYDRVVSVDGVCSVSGSAPMYRLRK